MTNQPKPIDPALVLHPFPYRARVFRPATIQDSTSPVRSPWIESIAASSEQAAIAAATALHDCNLAGFDVQVLFGEERTSSWWHVYRDGSTLCVFSIEPQPGFDDAPPSVVQP